MVFIDGPIKEALLVLDWEAIYFTGMGWYGPLHVVKHAARVSTCVLC